jgi:hypothetical protein
VSRRELPVAPGCSLDAAGATAQRARYAAVARGATLIERHRGKVIAELAELADERLLRELIAVERGCCPFLEIEYESARRRLAIAVSEPVYEPVLDTIASALSEGGGEAGPATRRSR